MFKFGVGIKFVEELILEFNVPHIFAYRHEDNSSPTHIF